MNLPDLKRKRYPRILLVASLLFPVPFLGAALATPNDAMLVTTISPTAATLAPGPGLLRDQGIPVAVFWREIFPAMLLVLAFAVVLSLAYVQLRREVARRRSAELRLEAARDLADSASLAKASFFATMSHEIRTPLSGIIGMLDLLRRGTMDGDHRQMITAVDTAANSLLQILDDVLDFSKAEANRLSLEMLPVDLRTIVHSVVMVIGEPARRRGVRTLLRVDANVGGEVQGDPLRIRQILSNLMSNAAKFTHQGQVTLMVAVDRSDAQAQWLRFTVTDTGIGIPHDKLAQVMAPYGQAEDGTSRHYGGTGLGLSVSSRLAALMGGNIALTSMPGHGTTATFTCRFLVTAAAPEPAVTMDLDVNSLASRVDKTPRRHQVIAARARAEARAHASLEAGSTTAKRQEPPPRTPLAAEGERAADVTEQASLPMPATTPTTTPTTAPTTAPTSTSTSTPMQMSVSVSAAAAASGGQSGRACILVVDDHAINREVVRRQLMTLGYDCDVKEDAPSALEALQQRSYALLLTDCQMPPMNGGELARAWRVIEAARGSARLPIVAMTATAERALPAPEICEAIDDCLYKPIKLDSLREMLAEWLPGPGTGDAGVVADAAMVMAPLHGLDLEGLKAQFGDALTARRFALQSVQLLRDDLAQARGPLCEAFYDEAARWLHRSVGALSMLGHWPVITSGSLLEKSMQQIAAGTPTEAAVDRADLLPRLAAVLREFEDTLQEIEQALQ
ncbi:hybrid sensor histidine kinase/response regulator [Bordetella sp. N]|uniref:hybrid sensor histidine kinase/response regulator n=1 Tax=Bordetella sp. N TaxID=1746199 RepID=UPI0018D20D96|nr:ATP-binding protein [Bordetella sp. N]